MKKILLLGGAAQQIIAIETAKKMGYYTIVCDYLEDNPGQYVADNFYLESTTDKETILKIAKEEGIHGILAYASDPAAPTAAYVAEQLNLPTNPYESVEILCNKDKFRLFLSENGFHAPKAAGYKSVKAAMDDIKLYELPVIIKPVDSSGSKGATVVHSLQEVRPAIKFAFSFSRSNRIIIEEFIEKKHPYLIGGDVFVNNGKIILWGLMNCHRDDNANPLVPVGKSYPLELDAEDIAQVKNTLQILVDKLHIKCGAMNVELIIDKNNRVWPIDIGPRNGGNMIPDLLGYIFDVDVVEMSVKAAMGEVLDVNITEEGQFYATHNLHSLKNGIFMGIEISKELSPYVVKQCIYKKPGDKVEFFDNAAKAVGIVFLKFNDRDEMIKILLDINEKIEIKVG